MPMVRPMSRLAAVPPATNLATWPIQLGFANSIGSFDETAGLHTFEEGEEPALVYSQLKRTEAGREASVPKNIRFSLEGALFDSGRTVGQQH